MFHKLVSFFQLSFTVATVALALSCSGPALGEAPQAPEQAEKTENPEKSKGEKTAKPSGVASGTVTCKKGGDTRTIANGAGAEGGCEVKYTKGGETSAVANAKVDTEHCTKVADKIKSNLTQSGYTCE